MLGQVGGVLISIGAVAILARLLRPADFGLVAMAFPVVVVGTVLRNFGLDIGAIYREQLDAALFNSLFWIGLRLNFLLSLALAALAPVLVWFYGEPRLFNLTAALAGGVLLLNLGAQPETLLKRQMRFRLLAFIALVSALAGAIAAVVAVSLHAGYWALALQTIVAFFVRSLLAWIFCRWRPLWPAMKMADARLRAMLWSGRSLTATRLLNLASNYCDRVIVGWLGGATVLGFYENGRRLGFLALDTLYAPLLDVAVAGFSRASRDDAQYRAFAIKTVELVLALIMPCLCFLLVEMESVTLLVLGKNWLPAVPYARLLVIAALAQSFTRLLMWFYLSRDQTARQLRWFALQTAVLLAAMMVGAGFGGAYGVAWGLSVATWVLTIPAIAYGLRESPLRPTDFARAAARPALLSIFAGSILFLIERIAHWSWPPLLHCSLALNLFGAIYMIGWLVIPGGAATVVQMIRLFSSGLGRRFDFNSRSAA